MSAKNHSNGLSVLDLLQLASAYVAHTINERGAKCSPFITIPYLLLLLITRLLLLFHAAAFFPKAIYQWNGYTMQ